MRSAAPHSSFSAWPQLTQRSLPSGTTEPMASIVSSASWAGPVWKSKASSPRTMYWQKVKSIGFT
jgi:hypothetical protein